MTKKQRKPIIERIVNRVGLRTNAQVKAIEATIRHRVAEAYEEGSQSGNDDPATSTFKAGGQGYRLMSGGVREPSTTWEENLAAAWDLKQSNPLVIRPSEISRDYIIGRGIQPKAADPELQTVLDSFWSSNKMSSFISELVQQWGDYGAQCIPCAVRHSDGRVALDYIDPGLIQRVITHPRKSRQMWAVVVKEQRNQDPWVPDAGVTVYKIVRKAEAVISPAQRFKMRHLEGCRYSPSEFNADDTVCPECGIELERVYPARTIEAKWHNPNDGEDSESEESTEGYWATAAQCPKEPWEIEMLNSFGLDSYTGDCFYLRKNADSNQPLGRSDYLAVADYCDRHDGVLFATAEKAEVAKFFMGLLRIVGDDDDVAEWQKKVNAWFTDADAGALLAVNESVTDLNLNAPTLSITDDVAAVDAVRKFILGGLGFPDAWFGAPGGTHLATVSAQGDPTWRTLAHDQGIVQAWFIEMLEFVRDQAIIAGAYTPEPTKDEKGNWMDPDTSVSLPMPEMTVKDMAGLTTALMSIVSAAQMAEQSGYINKANAIDLVAKIATELDVHPDVDELKEAAENAEQGKMLGMNDADIAINRQGWFSTHSTMEAGE